ncbi:MULTISPECIES: SPOR domain-containing protein [Acinetobacter]|uniref:SPOR domain-containing protein n=1 Tax=Acinetobacter TaxID=469 RepID=UPI00097FA319|nr:MULTISPECIES: SPOR domain-containing protein [Acinetobacter]MEB3795585.1 SPOR domain-containing protein [Acinetobacter sp. IK24]MEB3814734.1 SPOR domain-containing protein [Acinetobacter sp. IK22]MEB3833908.1 SPOR domain-containing protein [Acinetobacter sp. IK23]MEB3837793.1 SPOR domain-containing protein [Acinetobacter sp. IK25]
MSMNNKQRWMGGVVLLGGGVLLAALLLKGNEEIKHVGAEPQTSTSPKLHAKPKPSAQEGQMVQLQPLAVDVETEKRLLEEQRRSREKAVAEQEARAAEFLAMQQQAEADAARKAAAEYAAINARRAAAQESSDNIPPEVAGSDGKTKGQQTDTKKSVDTAKAEADKKAAEAKRQAEVDKKAAEAKKQAEADKKAAEAKHKAEAEKKAAEAKHQAEADKKAEAKKHAEAEKKTAEAKHKADAEKKAEAEKARELLENGDKKWMVQVALAANQANADAVVSKLRAKGYKVTTSPTSKGIRIMVGPAKDRDTADAARKKITSDSSLNMKSAWVIDWVPLDQR